MDKPLDTYLRKKMRDILDKHSSYYQEVDYMDDSIDTDEALDQLEKLFEKLTNKIMFSNYPTKEQSGYIENDK